MTWKVMAKKTKDNYKRNGDLLEMLWIIWKNIRKFHYKIKPITINQHNKLHNQTSIKSNKCLKTLKL
jgi:NDP-sugar pyrophosphorylase family protein